MVSREGLFIPKKVLKRLVIVHVSHSEESSGWLYVPPNMVAHRTMSIIPLGVKKGTTTFQVTDKKPLGPVGKMTMHYLIALSLQGLVAVPMNDWAYSYFQRIIRKCKEEKAELYYYILTVMGQKREDEYIPVFSFFTRTSDRMRGVCKEIIDRYLKDMKGREV